MPQVLPGVCTIAFALALPPRSRVALDLSLALRQMPTFGVVGTFAPSTSQPCPRTPHMAPALRHRRTVTSCPTRPHARCFYILDTGLHSSRRPLISPAFDLLSSHHTCSRARTSASHSSLCTSRAPPHFRAARIPSLVPPLEYRTSIPAFPLSDTVSFATPQA
ncbi:hypothetical protein B0H13DRAFT_2324802 [Mycena leptocephala]|nr:hypothetical protein B0H13DRAFT_2324802 [Mycena leptocephala]